MHLPSFTIVIPTFNRRALVCDVVAAVAKIRYQGTFDLIVVVDGSTDGTVDALAELSCPIRFQIIEQVNGGAASARNSGARRASGEIILFLDDDMICAPDVLEQHALSFANGADAVVGNIPLDRKSPRGFLSRAVSEWAQERAIRLAEASDIEPFEVLTGHLAVKSPVFRAIGGFDETFTQGGTYGNEDQDFGARLTRKYKVVFNPKAIAYQRYVVTPRQNMRQWRECGVADVRFARKHKERAGELFTQRGALQKRTRFLFRPLAALPLVPRVLSAAAIFMAERGGRTPTLNRWVGRVFYAAREIVYWSSVQDAIASGSKGPEVMVLCYHAFADLGGDPVLAQYGIKPSIFEGQINALLEAGFTFVSPDDVLNFLEDKAALPPSSLLLTFDDCYAELLPVARDILRPRGIRAIAFAVTDMPSSTNEWDQAIGAKRLQLLRGEQLRDLPELGIEIGSHSCRHQELPNVSDARLEIEILGSALALEELGLPRPRFFAYPYGTSDPRCRAAVKGAGYKAAFGLSRKRLSRTVDRFDLPRVEILARDDGWRFHVKTRWPRLGRSLA